MTPLRAGWANLYRRGGYAHVLFPKAGWVTRTHVRTARSGLLAPTGDPQAEPEAQPPAANSMNVGAVPDDSFRFKSGHGGDAR
jgi:hypothetical protein